MSDAVSMGLKVTSIEQTWCGGFKKLATTCACDFQQCGILTRVNSDKPVQPSFKLRNSI